ncbi:MAG: helix-turn-helix domain-containing protein [Acidimicrobiales bacterium]|nr:helix-turn-helix domain-containing protein [Acidimicrobiales bacterium]
MSQNETPTRFGDKNAAAALLSVSPRTIEGWTQKRLIPFIPISHRCVRYDIEELAKWALQQAVPIGGAGR